MDSTLGTVLGTAIGATSGLLGSLLGIWWQARLARSQRRLEKEKEERRLRLVYVNPLRSATIELKERIAALVLKYKNSKEKEEFYDWMKKIDDQSSRHNPEFFRWCNGYGAYPMSTLHLT